MPSRRLTAAAARRDATDADVYTGYRGVANTTVAKFSPSGYYIACGSTGGCAYADGAVLLHEVYTGLAGKARSSACALL